MRQQFNNKNCQKYQHGMSFIGLVFILAIVIFAAITVMKMAPAYIEFMSVKKVLHAMEQESLNTMSKKEIKDAYTKRASIDDIHSVTADDLIIEKNETGGTVVSAQYKVIKPLMGNVSVILDFATSSNAK